MNSVVISAILVILAFALFVFLTYRGFGMILTALLCTALISFASQDGFMTAFFTTFVGGMATLVQRLAISVLFGMAYGFILAASGASDAIGSFFVRKFGSKGAPFVIFVISIIFALAGLPATVFIVAPISYSLMKASNLPNYIGLMAYCCGVHLTIYGLPGVPHNMNIMPTTFLPTDIYAGGPLAYISVGIGYVLSILLIIFYVRKCRKKSIGFDVEGLYGEDATKLDVSNKPSFVVAIIPVVVMLVLCFIFIKVFNLPSAGAAALAQTVSIIIIMITCWKHFKDGWKGILKTFKNAFERSGSFLIGVGCLTGFASVAATTVFYQWIVEHLTGLNMSPYFMILISVAVITAVTSDAPSGIIMSLSTLGEKFTSMPGVDLSIVHRVTVMTATTFDSLPQCGAIVQYLECFGYTHKTGYKYCAITTIGITSIVALLYTTLATIFG